MNKLTKWWIDYERFYNEELEAVNNKCPHNDMKVDKKTWECYETMLRNMVPYGNTLENHQLYVEKSATGFINYLFDKYVDDNTLLITSVVEHDAVKEAIDRIGRKDKDHVIFHYYNGIDSLNLSQVKEAVMNKTYKKAFLYIIGTQITTGEITPQKFYEKVISYLKSKGIEVISVIDDVHGLFLVPRDYSIFDYVISTAHALIRRWDMGLMWSKTKETYGEKYWNWLWIYIGALNLMLKRQVKLSYFSQVMKEEFIDYLNKPYISLITDSVPHIFSLKIDCPPRIAYNQEFYEKCKDNEVRLESGNYEKDSSFYIRLRGSQYMTFPEMAEKGIDLIHQLLNKIEVIKEANG